MRNNRGQISEGITAPVVLFVVVVELALFALLSAGIFQVVTPSSAMAQSFIDPKVPYSYDPLFKILIVSIDNKNQFVNVFDLLTNSYTSINSDSVKNALNYLASKEGKCLIATHAASIIAANGPNSAQAFTGQQGYFVEPAGARNVYDSTVSPTLPYPLTDAQVSFASGNSISLSYYYGGCLNG